MTQKVAHIVYNLFGRRYRRPADVQQTWHQEGKAMTPLSFCPAQPPPAQRAFADFGLTLLAVSPTEEPFRLSDPESSHESTMSSSSLS